VDEDTAAVMEERGRLGGGALACRRALLARGKRDGLLRDEGSEAGESGRFWTA